MNVLWITNFVLPQIAERVNCTAGVNEGWLAGLCDVILKQQEVVLGVCFPNKSKISGKINDQLFFYSYEPEGKNGRYVKSQEAAFERIYNDFHPDVIHIMGSEFPHALAAVNASIKKELIDNTVLSIQGLVSVYCNYFYEGVPLRTILCPTVKDIIKGTALCIEKKRFSRRGKYEIETISKLNNIIGRTDWDYACAKEINNNIRYFFNNETLRKEFYQDELWNYNICEKHSIFISQATMPFKGFHTFLVAAGLVKRRYPDMKIYVASNVNYLKRVNSWSQTRSAYTNLIIKLTKKYNLEDSIVFCGALSAEKMKERYLKSNVFVLPSAIENSPNSLGEAMILGVPIVTSDVGGIMSMITHEREGFVCQYNAPYMFAHYIMRIFEEGEKASLCGMKAREHARSTHDGQRNYNALLRIYGEISLDRNKMKIGEKDGGVY